MFRKLLKGIAILLLAVVIVVGGYAAYLLIDYHRLPDTDEAVDLAGEAAQAGETYTMATWNLGFGAYSADYGFFMDGGTESRAFSKDAVYDNLNHAVDVLRGLNADFILLQELDTDATRSYHVDEAAYMTAQLAGWKSAFAQNYDSAYLFYPILKPHGASKAGILTLTNRGAERFARVSLPMEKGLMKFLDLDRCYSKLYVPVANGRTLVLFNLHLSAYTSDGTIADDQLAILTADMLSEYEVGNYAIAGGDFNKDLLGNSAEVFDEPEKEYTWNRPIREDAIPGGLTLVNSLDADDPIPSNRIADGPYVKGVTLVNTLDGFIVSDNVTVEQCRVIDDGFACSDHNPVVMTFSLDEADQ